MRFPFLKLRLTPDPVPTTDPVAEEGATPPEQDAPEAPSGDQGAGVDVKALQESVSRLEGAIEAERKLKRDAEAAARKAKEDAENAKKTAEQLNAERLDALESRNRELELRENINSAIVEQKSKLEEQGFVVDEGDLRRLLAISSVSSETAESVVGTLAETLKRPKSAGVGDGNKNPNPGNPGANKIEWGKLPDSALVN